MIFDRAMTMLKHSTFTIINYDISKLEHEESSKIKPIIKDWHEETAVPPPGIPIEVDIHHHFQLT